MIGAATEFRPTPRPAPPAAAVELRETLAVLCEPGAVYELRALHVPRDGTVSGYYDNADALARDAAKLDARGDVPGIYVTVNPTSPDLLARACNRYVPKARNTTTDSDIIGRHWLPIDLDPVRPAGVSATDEEHDAALALAPVIVEALVARGIPAESIVTADSGNGAHVLVRVDLPNDTDTPAFVKRCLAALDALFSTDAVKVDPTTSNAARIWKLYGTHARKGDSTPDRPHRLARLLTVPDEIVVAPREALERLAELAPTAPSPRDRGGDRRGGGALDVDAWLARAGLAARRSPWQDGTRWVLSECPFAAGEHGADAAAFIVQLASGALSAGCQHARCSWGWSELRERYEPGFARRNGNGHFGGHAGATLDEWPEPEPLVAHFGPEPYPTDALPEIIRATVEEVQNFVQAPVALVAGAALGAASAVVQAHVDVRRADRLTGPSGLFLLSIADSGERKTTCDQFFLSALVEYEKQEREAAKPERTRHAAEIAAWEARHRGVCEAIKAAEKSGKATDSLERKLANLEAAKPTAPRVPCILRQDDTPESLAHKLAHEWPSAAVVSSEAALVFGGHAMGRDSIMRNLAQLNILWDGGTLKIGRRSADGSFSVAGARLTMSLQIQEATLREFLAASGPLARGSGFLARFLVAWPESTQGTRMFREPPEHLPALGRYHHRLAEILNTEAPIGEDGALSPTMLTLSSAAKAAWVAFHDEVEAELRPGGELDTVRDVASKVADNAVRLAAVFHVVQHGMAGPIGENTFAGAARLAAWHLSEARRFFGELAVPQEQAAMSKLDGWLVAYCRRERTDRVSTRDVARLGPNGLRAKATIEAVVRDLEELGRARLVLDGRSKGIAVNPGLLERGDA